MTATSCREKFDKRNCKEGVTIEAGSSGYRVKRVRTHVRHFLVETNNKYDGPFVAMQHPSVPRVFDLHPEDSYAFCREVVPTQYAGAKAWEIVCSYSTEVPDPSQEEEDPLARPVRRWLEFNEIKVPMYEDRDGNPVVNTAGVPYNPPVEVPVRTVVFCFERNEPSFNIAYGLSILNKVNSVMVSGIDPGYLLCNHLAPEEKYEKGRTFVQCQYKFEYNPIGWQPSPLSRGVFERDSESGDLIRIKDKVGRDVTEPVPLDTDGYALGPDDVLNNPSLLVYQEFHHFEEADFDGITNLPFWT